MRRAREERWGASVIDPIEVVAGCRGNPEIVVGESRTKVQGFPYRLAGWGVR